LAIAANNDSKTYNGSPYSGGNGVTYTGFVNGEGVGVLTGTLTYNAGTSQGAINVGNYTITPGGQTSSNYAISYVNGTLTISPATLTASIIGAPTKIYDGTTLATLTSGNFSLTGFAPGEGATVTQTVGTYNSADVTSASSITANLSSGNYSANLGTLLTNYTLPTSATGAASITTRTLTVTPNNVFKGYGALDNLSYSVSGVQPGDTQSNVISGNLSRAPGENVGSYAISNGTVAVTDSNYSYNYLTDFTTGKFLTIVPLTEPWQPTTLFTQAGTSPTSTLNSQLAQIDSQQSQPLTVYQSKDVTYKDIPHWDSGNGPAVTILDGGVRMPDDNTDENRKDQQ
jgi:hypothetical protein